MNAINKIELNQEINSNYDKLVYLHEQYEITCNNFERLKTDSKREKKRIFLVTIFQIILDYQLKN